MTPLAFSGISFAHKNLAVSEGKDIFYGYDWHVKQIDDNSRG